MPEPPNPLPRACPVCAFQGEEPPQPPPLPDLRGQVGVGVRSGVREVAVRFVRRIYEHLAVWQLGAARAAPFLRDGVLWVHHVSEPIAHTVSPHLPILALH